MKLVFALIVVSTLGASVIWSWIGAMAYYTLAIWGPQYIWFWLFTDLRISKLVALTTFAGVTAGFFKTGYDLRFVYTKLNFFVLLLYLSILLSYMFGPYVDNPLNKVFDPHILVGDISKIFLFYFIATLVINEIQVLKYFAMLFVVVTVYYCYWANWQYLSGNWSQFYWGRLMGPFDADGYHIYKDENTFAMLFVTGLPFLYYFSLQTWKFIRWGCLGIILLGWHGIFLTGSRGGIVGLAVIVLSAIFWTANVKKHLWLRLMIIPFFLAIYSWQAGGLMKQRSSQIVDVEGESSAQARLIAWRTGYQMFKDHPFTGVGLASFITAWRTYDLEEKPHVAHNTMVEFTAECGMFAGLAYCMIALVFLHRARQVALWLKTYPDHAYTRIVEFCNNSSKVSFMGLSVCSLFLSLNYYEIYFYLLIINNSLYTICVNEHYRLKQIRNAS